MARIRSIKPEFWTDEKIVALSPLARLLFIGMWNFVDDEGRAEFSPMRMKMQILPADAADMSALLGEIRGASLIVVYAVDGKEYFQVKGFTKHQRVDKRSPSKIPPPTNSAESPRIPTTEKEEEREKEGKGEEKEEGSRAKAREAAADMAFVGRIIRLNVDDFERWRRAYSAIPDLAAELTKADDYYFQNKPDGKWWFAVSGWLKKAHEDALAKKAKPKYDKSKYKFGITPDDPDYHIYRAVN